ncbi:putative RING-H2 finger protein ATL12 [Curcuma longa]|uniref:putative RING-H2 finger protein ATL12 n=1 Tax=Curcuma longa TaxID=136217 RepID=UPI003D9E9A33
MPFSSPSYPYYSSSSSSSARYFFFVVFYLLGDGAGAQKSDADTWSPPNVGGVTFRPAVAIVIGVFSIMFALTFLLLIYAKFCHTNSSAVTAAAASSELLGAEDSGNGRFLVPGLHCSSGIDNTVIESLPFFRFSALRGVRAGLECAVCLSKFTDAEKLRLLPKCRHAFHLNCVDRWLESHSSCPLCRAKVKAEDAALFKCSASARLLFASDSSDALDLFVEREIEGDGDSRVASSRFSFRKISDRSAAKLGQNDHEMPMLETGDGGGQFLHKFKHKIIVSDVVFKSRWSDVNSSDLMTLSSEMLSKDWNLEPIGSAAFAAEGRASIDEKVIKIKQEMEKKRILEIKASQIQKTHSSSLASIPSNTSRAAAAAAAAAALISSPNRSMSEITNLSRFRQQAKADYGGGATSEDEKVRRVWLPIAQRTVQWFAGRDQRRSSETETSHGGITSV